MIKRFEELKEHIGRTVDTSDGRKVISYDGGSIFEEYNLQNEPFHKTLSVGCRYIDYDIDDTPINRRINLTRMTALALAWDLIKFVLKGKL